MTKISEILLIITMLLLSTCAEATTNDTMKSQLIAVADHARELYQLPGLEISIRNSSGQSMDIYRGAMTKNSAEPINENTLFQIGSTTKTYIAALMLNLADDHVLNLNDTVGQWLPEYPAWSKITLVQLLNHTSGIYDYMSVPFWWFRLDFSRSKIWTPAELVDLSYSRSLYFPTGLGWHYSNTDYVLLGMIIEKATKLSVADALNKYVYKKIPGRLTRTYYIPTSLKPSLNRYLAHGYRNGSRDMTSINTSWLQAGGAMISTAHDLSNWFWTVFTNKVITDKDIKKMTTFVSLKSGKLITDKSETGYGLGVFSMTTPDGLIWFTPGLTPGYTSLVAWLPCKKIALAYTTNNSSSKVGLHVYLITQLLQVINTQDSKKCVNEPTSAQIIFPTF